MNSKVLSIVMVGLLIFSVGVSGCTGSNGGNGGDGSGDTNELESGSVTAEYTDDISVDTAMLVATNVDNVIDSDQREFVIKQKSSTVDIRKEGETIIIRMETGFSSADEIPATGEGLQRNLLGVFKGGIEDEVKLILLSESGEEIRTLE